MTDTGRLSKTELLEKIQHSYDRLEQLLRSVSVERLSQPGSDGWAIKDHLAHLAAWELGVADLLRGRSRAAAMGISEADQQTLEFDQINQLLYQQHRELEASDALELLRRAHQTMRQAVEQLDETDLYKPYAAYLTGNQSAQAAWAQDPVINWIVGDSFDHYDEHYRYIHNEIQQFGLA